jgi:uncharacterized repeat protein (TIGR01451 family)
MKITTMKNFFLIYFTTFLFLIAPGQVLAKDGTVKFSNKVFKQVVVTNKKGEKEFSYVEPTIAVPGDVMLYSITFENIGKETVSNIVVNDPIPNNSKYRMNSANGKDTKITFSIDGGKSFGNPKDLIVKDKTGKTWVAKPEEYTHIRWVYGKSLAPGEKGEVSFKTSIKGNE